MAELTQSFLGLRRAFVSRQNIDNNTLRQIKQTHKRVITDLCAQLNVAVPEGLMTAFDDHQAQQQTTITLAPGFGNSRLRQRFRSGLPGLPRTPGGIPRPPSLRDRMGLGNGPP
jgi:hypothetical protein